MGRRAGQRILALFTAVAVLLSLMIVVGAPARSADTAFIQIKKLAPDDPNVSFAFSGSGGNGEIGDFSLKHLETSTAFEVPLNTPFTITETAPEDNHWYLENINCDDTGGTAVVDLGDDPNTGSVTITVTDAGVLFGCNFDNEFSENALNTGRLIVEKKADDDFAQEFKFTVEGDGEVEEWVINDLRGGGEKIDMRVPLNTPFVVTEVDPDGLWYLEGVTCDETGGEAVIDETDFGIAEGKNGGSITMTVTGQQFECNFDNEHEGGSPTTTTTAPTTTTTAPTTTTTAPTTTTTAPTTGPSGDDGSGTFVDDDGSIFEADIEWLAAEGVTKGCNPPANTKFCPNDAVSRGQMAAFIVRFLGLTANTHGGFSDVPAGSTFANDIGKLATAGITKGCNPPANTKFCPNDEVSRGQMAAFLVRALDLTKDTHSGFDDVPATNTFVADIEKLATAGITKGCNPPANTKFCPNDAVSRGQMAAFLHRAGPLR